MKSDIFAKCNITLFQPRPTLFLWIRQTKNLITSFPKVEFGAHLHVNPLYAQELISASFEGGCMRFDTAMKGFGGCPMAKDDLTGNLPTEELIKWINKNNMKNDLDQNAVSLVMDSVSKVFESTQ